MEFLTKKMYKIAIGYAKERNHTEIVELLSKDPIRTEKSSSNQKKKAVITQSKISASTNAETSKEISRLKHLLDILKSAIFQRTFPAGAPSSADNFFIDEWTEDEFIHNVGKIGEGATSIAYKCIDTSTNQTICKKVLKYKNEQTNIKDAQNAMKEFQVLHDIDHPCICKSFYINTEEPIDIINKDEEDSVTTISLFLEFVEYGLSDILKNKINDTLKANIVVEIAHAMKYLHARGMIHRDLKIENIMVNSVYQTKLVDFGLIKNS